MAQCDNWESPLCPRPAPAQEGSADGPRHCQGSQGSVGSAGSRDSPQHPSNRDPFPRVKQQLFELRRLFKPKLLSLLNNLLFPSHRAIKSHPGRAELGLQERPWPEQFPQPCRVCSSGMLTLLSGISLCSGADEAPFPSSGLSRAVGSVPPSLTDPPGGSVENE